MTAEGRKKLIWLFKTAFVTAGVYIFLKYALSAVMPFVIAYALYRLLEPAVLFLYRKLKIPAGISATVLVTAVFMALAGLSAAFFKYVFGQIQNLFANADRILAVVSGVFDSLCDGLSGLLGCESSAVSDKLSMFLRQMAHGFSDNFYMIMKEHAVPAAGKAVTLFVIVTIGAVSAALLIKNKKVIDGDIRRSEFFFEISEITARIAETVGCFFKAQGIIISIVAVICTVGLKLSGTGYALLIGLSIALLDALPVIGSGTILVPWIVIDFFMGNYRHGIALLVIYGLCAVVREVLEARLMGSRLGINEFYMMAVTFIGMKLFGISGIILGPVGLILILEILSQLKKRYNL